MTDPVPLLREWRDARQAIFDTDMTKLPLPDHKPYWDRLGKAEHALMDFARSLGPDRSQNVPASSPSQQKALSK